LFWACFARRNAALVASGTERNRACAIHWRSNADAAASERPGLSDGNRV
jgi:hypothetical protein